MNSVPEIEQALRQLAPREKWEIARWLLEDLQGVGVIQPSAATGQTVPSPLPDYSARRRRIFGDKTLPNMVLTARADERW